MHLHSPCATLLHAREELPMLATPTRSAPLSAGCLIIILVIVAGLILFAAERFANGAERDARAPVVIVGPATSCSVSPDGQYLLAGVEPKGRFYDVSGSVAQAVDLPLEAVFDGRAGGNFWLADDRYFVYHVWDDEFKGTEKVRTPRDGYVLDIGSRTITDITALSAADQTAIVQLAVAQLQANPFARERFLSLDGRYRFWDAQYTLAQIYTSNRPSNDPNAVLNLVRGNFGAIYPCILGWRTDSQGYYFIDGNGQNPIRLLLTHPPFPIWAWVWRGVGIAASLTLLVLAWRLRN
jgi:hypothetical protein